MKRLLFAPLLLTFLVGCGSAEKTYIQRRNDCADVNSKVISRDEFIEKYKIGQKDDSGYEGYYKEDAIDRYLDYFCDFYK